MSHSKKYHIHGLIETILARALLADATLRTQEAQHKILMPGTQTAHCRLFGGGRLEFVKVAETSEIPVGKSKVVTIQGKEILVTNINGNYYAIGNKCTHAGADLSKGPLEGSIITCPRHKARFDVTTGKVVYRPKYWMWELKLDDEPVYEVKVDRNNVLIKY